MDGYEDIEESQETTGGPAPPKEGATEGGETVLIPKSLLQGKEYKAGETIRLKVVHIYEDELEVQPETYKEQEEKEERDDPEDMSMSGVEESPEMQLDRLAVPA